MSKRKKQKTQDAATEEGVADPNDVLRRPAQPPQANMVAFLIALGLFFVWFVYLVYVAVAG